MITKFLFYFTLFAANLSSEQYMFMLFQLCIKKPLNRTFTKFKNNIKVSLFFYSI